MKALFIGGTGTISTAIVKKLAEDPAWEVWLLNRGNRSDVVPENVHQIVCDINDEEAVKKALEGMTFDVVGEFIGFTVDQVERDYRLFKDIQHKPLIGASVTNVNELFSYVNHNKGIAILSEFAYNDLVKRSSDNVHAAFICDESDNLLTIPYHIYWRKSGNTDAVIRLRDCIIDYFHDLK